MSVEVIRNPSGVGKPILGLIICICTIQALGTAVFLLAANQRTDDIHDMPKPY